MRPKRGRGFSFTIVYRAFLQRRRHEHRFPEIELVDGIGPALMPDFETTIDSASARAALLNLPDVFRVPVTLFYLEQHSYKEIAEIRALSARSCLEFRGANNYCAINFAMVPVKRI